MQAKSFLQEKYMVLESIMFLCCKLPRDFGEFSINAERARKGMHVHMDSNISHSAFVFSACVHFCSYRKGTGIE